VSGGVGRGESEVGTAVPELLLESYARNGRVNAAVLDALTEADLDLSDGRGGWNVGQHLGHLARFRKGWLGNLSPTHAEAVPQVTQSGEGGLELTTRDLQEIAAALGAGDAAARQAVEDALRDGRVFEDPWDQKEYQGHPAHFLQHIIVHDSHHRGQIMALLRLGGRSKEQLDALEETTWPIWTR
jgi:uncharacterized damage-inducible protein DinB